MLDITSINILSIFYQRDMKRSNDKNVKELDLCGKIPKWKSLIFHALFILGFGKHVFSFLMRNINLNEYSLIVVNEMAYAECLIKYIREKNKTCSIVYWLWNTLSLGSYMKCYDKYKHFKILKSLETRYRFKIISFDFSDCKMYNLVHVNQIACRYPMKSEEKSIDIDIFFVGKDKKRLDLIKRLAKIFSDLGLVFECWLVPSPKNTYTAEEKSILYVQSNWIPYEEIVRYNCKSKVLLDLVQENQDGLTWRPIEALYYKKKLITNYEKIVKFDFYCKDNIFILGIDDLSRLPSFVDSAYKEVDTEIINKYTYLGVLNSVINL